MFRRVEARRDHDGLPALQIPHLELGLAGLVPGCRGCMSRQRDVDLGRLRAVLVGRRVVAQPKGPGTGSARVAATPRPARAERREAVDASEYTADFLGTEEAVLDRQAGGAQTEAGFEQGEIGGQGGDVCEWD